MTHAANMPDGTKITQVEYVILTMLLLLFQKDTNKKVMELILFILINSFRFVTQKDTTTFRDTGIFLLVLVCERVYY